MQDIFLSIIIPVYNYDCYDLVRTLHTQLTDNGMTFEIIVAEDGSREEEALQSNRRIAELTHCRYIPRKENVGRAHVCNFMLSESTGQWILIMDADAVVPDDTYISNYQKAFDEYDVDVLHGGLYHSEKYFKEGTELRWTYERAADRHRGTDELNINPFKSFSTFNVAIRRSLFASIGFDENCKEYGYEDALLGINLKEKGATIRHIHNPLIHVGLDSNAAYLQKVETSLRTLRAIRDKFNGQTTLLKAYTSLKSYHMAWLPLLLYKLFKPLMRRNLLGRKPNLKVLALYKLGYYISLG